jgi:hypothetical protein
VSSDSTGEFIIFNRTLQDLRHHKSICITANTGEVNKNAQGPLHVEARTHLQPAVDFFSRAVAAAEGSNSLTGELLSSVRITAVHFMFTI